MRAIVLGLGGRTPSGGYHSGGNYRPQPWTFSGPGLGADDEAPAASTPEPGSQKQDRSWWPLAVFAVYTRIRRRRR